MLDDSPRCQECGVKLDGRDVYEGVCKSCREEMILSGKRPSPDAAKSSAAPQATDADSSLPGQVSTEEDTKEMEAVEPASNAAPAPAPQPEEAPAAPAQPKTEDEPAPAPEPKPDEKATSPLLTEDEEDVDLEPLDLELEGADAAERQQAQSEPKAEASSKPPPPSPEPAEAAEEKSAAEKAEDYVPAILAPQQNEPEPAAKETPDPAPAAAQEADTDAVEVEEEEILRLRMDAEAEEAEAEPSADTAGAAAPTPVASSFKAPRRASTAERSDDGLREEVQQLRLRLQGLSARLEKAERASRGGRGPTGSGFRFAIGMVLGLGVLALLVGGGMYAVGKLVHPPTLEFLQRVLSSVGAG